MTEEVPADLLKRHVQEEAAVGLELLSIVYGFLPDLQYPHHNRVEFSIHPLRRGWKHTHTLCWELTSPGAFDLKPPFVWPNRFSRMIGDKFFGGERLRTRADEGLAEGVSVDGCHFDC